MYPGLPHPHFRVIQQTHVYLLLSLVLNIYLEVPLSSRNEFWPIIWPISLISQVKMMHVSSQKSTSFIMVHSLKHFTSG